ncbi:MAG: non-canonical purine NTP pyrophosphatase, partial [Clostridia bacterium]|nr:non-canonical purine NTP pyrophosphatase [Clostridia bacterium]
MKFLIATHNMKKREELQRILEPLNITVLTAEEADVDLRDIEETGTTFEENAILKAEGGRDDSGLP